MITLRKLASLPKGTKVRKAVRLLEYFQKELRLNQPIDLSYLQGLITLILEEVDDVAIRAKLLAIDLEGEILWPLSDALLLLHQSLGIEQADWDFDEFELEKGERRLYPFSIVLDRLRSPFNVGSIFRTAESFGVNQIYLIEPSAAADHPRAIRSGRGCQAEIPWQSIEEGELLELIGNRPLFALESGGEDINHFEFPVDGVAIIGSEELGVSPAMLAAADNSLGRVTIPLFGKKGSLNVSVAFGILMNVWFTQIDQRENQ